MAALTYGDLASKTYEDLQNLTYSFEDNGSSSGSGEIGNTTTSLSQEDIDAIAAAVWNYSTKVVTVNDTQAAKFMTATGFATPTNVTAAQNAIILEGNSKWTTATGFVTSLNGVAQENSLTTISTLIQTIIALLADFSVNGSTLTITVNNTDKTYTITKSDGNIISVHPTKQQ